MQHKRILFVVYELPPIGGGVATAASHLLREFAQLSNFEIDVVTSSVENKWEQESFSKNITIYKVPIGDKAKRLQKQSLTEVFGHFFLKSGWQILGLLRKNKYDAVHYFGYPGAFWRLLHFWKVPFIVSLRGVDVPGYNPEFSAFTTIQKLASRFAWSRAKAVIANSQKLKALALETAPNIDIKVIPNGVNTDLFRPLPSSKKHKKFSITAGGTLMGPKKRLHLLIEGFALFHKKHPNSQLILFGDGVERRRLETLSKELGVAKSVLFKGRVTHEQLARELPKCHVFCLPSVAEGMSNAMLEAAACGLPVIMGDVGGVEEMKLFSVTNCDGDPSSICQMIESVLNFGILSFNYEAIPWSDVVDYYKKIY